MVKSVSDRRDCGMIRIGNLVLPPDGNLELVRKRAANALGVRPGALGELEIIRQSIDARKRAIFTTNTPWRSPFLTKNM